jgi:hypothetical protein
MKTTHQIAAELLQLPDVPLRVEGWCQRDGYETAAVMTAYDPENEAILIQRQVADRLGPMVIIPPLPKGYIFSPDTNAFHQYAFAPGTGKPILMVKDGKWVRDDGSAGASLARGPFANASSVLYQADVSAADAKRPE